MLFVTMVKVHIGIRFRILHLSSSCDIEFMFSRYHPLARHVGARPTRLVACPDVFGSARSALRRLQDAEVNHRRLTLVGPTPIFPFLFLFSINVKIMIGVWGPPD
jgi:hypothetical protein